MVCRRYLELDLRGMCLCVGRDCVGRGEVGHKVSEVVLQGG